MLPKTIIGVMGPGKGASDEDLRLAEELGGETIEKIRNYLDIP